MKAMGEYMAGQRATPHPSKRRCGRHQQQPCEFVGSDWEGQCITHPEPSVPFCPVHGLSIYADPPCCDGNAPPPESPLPVRDCKPCHGAGWLHYSTGAPMDVCDDCHGTGCTSAYAAYNLIERLTNGK